jgi:hypothetical protein
MFGMGQRVGQRTRVEDRLRGAVGADRIHRMRSVAEQRDAASSSLLKNPLATEEA